MLEQEEVKQALKKFERALPELKKAAGPFQSYALAGVIDALKYVLEEESHVPVLLKGIKGDPQEEEPRGLILPPMSTNS